MKTANNLCTLPPFWISAIPLVLLISLLAINVIIFGSDSLAGPSQVVLILASAVAVALGVLVCKVKWECIENAIMENIHTTSMSIYILLSVGMLSASWMLSGVVPTMVYYGIKVMDARIFLVTACLLCALVSMSTGSSWTTIATIGIAIMGIGRALGFSDGWTAGAIICGAYFGDKMSPLSDTTVLASSVSETPLFSHVRYMAYTSGPAMLVSLAIFAVVGFVATPSMDVNDSFAVEQAIESTFNISLWLMIVPVITGYLIYKRYSSLVVLIISSVSATIATLIAQPHILMAVGTGVTTCNLTAEGMYTGVIKMLAVSTSVDTGNEIMNNLVSTGGMAGMLNTIWLIIAAMAFGGIMKACGMIQSFFYTIFRHIINTRVGLISATIVNGIFLNIITGDQYIAIVLTSNMFKDEYERQGYENRLLSRTTEDGATVTSVLIPWSTCGMTQSTVLGVSTLVYFPYCFFCYLSPLMSIVLAATGWTIKREKQTKS